MANICENELRFYTDNPENIKVIDRFFNKEFLDSDKQILNDSGIINFGSKWTFPKKEMDQLAKQLPDLENLSMSCLSVDWGNYYCEFHYLSDDGDWILN